MTSEKENGGHKEKKVRKEVTIEESLGRTSKTIYVKTRRKKTHRSQITPEKCQSPRTACYIGGGIGFRKKCFREWMSMKAAEWINKYMQKY
jgi:hypothetical protein